MKKFILGIGIVAVLGLYVVFQKFGGTPVDPQFAANDTATAGSSISQPSTPQAISDQSVAVAGSAGPDPSSLGSGAASGMYKDGTYTGIVADAYYGPLQVSAVIQNGNITDIKFVQYPNDRGESIEVNQYAMPRLKSEAIQSQSANVNTVSGATQSSEAFNQSLASALSQARS